MTCSLFGVFSQVRVVNHVYSGACSSNAGKRQLPAELVAASIFGRCGPNSFPSCPSHGFNPSATTSWAVSGRVVITGAKDKFDAILAAYLNLYRIQKHSKLYRQLRGLVLQNLVGAVDLGAEVDLEKMHKDDMLNTFYEPDQFPGLQKYPAGSGKKKEVIVVYRSGKAVLAGPRTPDALMRLFERHKAWLYKYTKEKGPKGGKLKAPHALQEEYKVSSSGRAPIPHTSISR